MSKIKANVIFSINVNLLKCVFLKYSLEILNLEYSGWLSVASQAWGYFFFPPCSWLKAPFNIYVADLHFKGRFGKDFEHICMHFSKAKSRNAAEWFLPPLQRHGCLVCKQGANHFLQSPEPGGGCPCCTDGFCEDVWCCETASLPLLAPGTLISCSTVEVGFKF